METYDFSRQVLDSVDDRIVVIDRDGQIQFANRAWVKFSAENSGATVTDWHGVNYLEMSEQAAAAGHEFGLQAAKGIRHVIEGQDLFYGEYAHHRPAERRWFMVKIAPLEQTEGRYLLILHRDITARKLAEQEILQFSRKDGLTGLANRCHFDEFLDLEWRRCLRLGFPISLAIIDIDHFKLLNDTYGHQVGDECLKAISAALPKFARRPSDLCARYGGEEFAIIYGNSTAAKLQELASSLLTSIREMRIANEKAPTGPYATISMGLATVHPNRATQPWDLTDQAEALLGSAKSRGRDQIASS